MKQYSKKFLGLVVAVCTSVGVLVGVNVPKHATVQPIQKTANEVPVTASPSATVVTGTVSPSVSVAPTKGGGVTPAPKIFTPVSATVTPVVRK